MKLCHPHSPSILLWKNIFLNSPSPFWIEKTCEIFVGSTMGNPKKSQKIPAPAVPSRLWQCQTPGKSELEGRDSPWQLDCQKNLLNGEVPSGKRSHSIPFWWFLVVWGFYHLTRLIGFLRRGGVIPPPNQWKNPLIFNRKDTSDSNGWVFSIGRLVFGGMVKSALMAVTHFFPATSVSFRRKFPDSNLHPRKTDTEPQKNAGFVHVSPFPKGAFSGSSR